MAVFDGMKGINLAAQFVLQSEAPLDARSVVSTIEERDELATENGAYAGMLVYVTEKSTYYKYDGENWSSLGEEELTPSNDVSIPTSSAVANYLTKLLTINTVSGSSLDAPFSSSHVLTYAQFYDSNTKAYIQLGLNLTTNQICHRVYNTDSSSWSDWCDHTCGTE